MRNRLEGRDRTTGRFAPGWKGGPGTPYGRAVARLRAAMMEEVTADDLRRIVRVLVNLALKGDIAAAKEVLARCLGPYTETDLIERLEELEELVRNRNGGSYE